MGMTSLKYGCSSVCAGGREFAFYQKRHLLRCIRLHSTKVAMLSASSGRSSESMAGAVLQFLQAPAVVCRKNWLSARVAALMRLASDTFGRMSQHV